MGLSEHLLQPNQAGLEVKELLAEEALHGVPQSASLSWGVLKMRIIPRITSLSLGVPKMRMIVASGLYWSPLSWTLSYDGMRRMI